MITEDYYTKSIDVISITSFDEVTCLSD